VAGLNAMLGAGTYAYIDTGVIGTDAIRVGLIYKPGSK
jgi:predicted extracellular nuclease